MNFAEKTIQSLAWSGTLTLSKGIRAGEGWGVATSASETQETDWQWTSWRIRGEFKLKKTWLHIYYSLKN